MKRYAVWAWSLLILLSGFWSCQAPRLTWSGSYFYYWKTTLDLTAADHQALGDWQVKGLYVRLADLNWQAGQWSDDGLLKVKTALPADLDWVPVVYLTTSALEHLTVGNSAAVAQRLISLVSGPTAQAVSTRPFRELQLDADWTASTRERYFSLVQTVRDWCRSHQLALTVTLRLHQVRDRAAMGVPPVDRVTLMLYGAADPLKAQSPDKAILDSRLVQGYLQGHLADYPLAVDLAFPVYSQARIFNPFGRPVGLIAGVAADELADSARFRPVGPGHWEVLAKAYLRGNPVLTGDEVYLDASESAEVTKSRDLVQANLPAGAQPRLLLFDFDSVTIRSAHVIRQILLP